LPRHDRGRASPIRNARVATSKPGTELLATARDPVTQVAVLEREERAPERRAVTPTTNENPKEHHHG
jgi:hypothetical protein